MALLPSRGSKTPSIGRMHLMLIPSRLAKLCWLIPLLTARRLLQANKYSNLPDLPAPKSICPRRQIIAICSRHKAMIARPLTTLSALSNSSSSISSGKRALLLSLKNLTRACSKNLTDTLRGGRQTWQQMSQTMFSSQLQKLLNCKNK